MFRCQIKFASADTDRIRCDYLGLQMSLRPLDLEVGSAGRDVTLTVVIVNLIPDFNGLRTVQVDRIQDDQDVRLHKNDRARDSGNGVSRETVGFRRNTGGTHPTKADLVSHELGPSAGCVGAFFASVVDVTATIDEQSGMSFGFAE